MVDSVVNGDNADIEMCDIKEADIVTNSFSEDLVESARKDEIIKSQLQVIKNQAEIIQKMKDKDKKDPDQIQSKTVKSKSIPKSSNELKYLPKHLSPVHAKHHTDLGGYKMKADGNAGGDCLSSVTTMHLSYTRNKFERKNMNRKINHHIADNWDNFYKNKISLPYTETVGVGSAARQVTCSTRQDMLDFLRSDDSLCTYSNYAELLAICNMLAININVFTYDIGGDSNRWGWKTIYPDPEMSAQSEFSPGTVPHMSMYNSDNCHYDLLVETNSRLAVLGFISIGEEKELDKSKTEVNKDKIKEKEIEKGHEEEASGEGEIQKDWRED